MFRLNGFASRPDRERERQSSANGPVTTTKLSREQMDAYFESIKDKIPKQSGLPINVGKDTVKRRGRRK